MFILVQFMHILCFSVDEHEASLLQEDVPQFPAESEESECVTSGVLIC